MNSAQSIRQLTKFVRKLHLKSNSCILVQNDVIPESAMKDFIAALQDYFKKTKVENVFVLRVSDINEVECLDEDMMSKHGWVRKERVQGAILKLLTKSKADSEKSTVEIAKEDDV